MEAEAGQREGEWWVEYWRGWTTECMAQETNAHAVHTPHTDRVTQ